MNKNDFVMTQALKGWKMYNTKGELLCSVDAKDLEDFNKNVKSEKHRCDYCGCLISKFDTHCPNCSAPL